MSFSWRWLVVEAQTFSANSQRGMQMNPMLVFEEQESLKERQPDIAALKELVDLHLTLAGGGSADVFCQ